MTNDMINMVTLAARKAGWTAPIGIAWEPGSADSNPITILKIESQHPEVPKACTMTFGPQSTPFSTDFDFRYGDGSVVTASQGNTVKAIALWLSVHMGPSDGAAQPVSLDKADIEAGDWIRLEVANEMEGCTHPERYVVEGEAWVYDGKVEDQAAGMYVGDTWLPHRSVEILERRPKN